MYGCCYGCFSHIIRWSKLSEFEEIASEFEKVGRFFPNVIEAIEGLHLEMKLIEEQKFEPSFINYKQFHSVHLQLPLIVKKLFGHLYSYGSFTLGDSHMATNKQVLSQGVTDQSPHTISQFFSLGDGILGPSDLHLGKKVGSLNLGGGGYSGTLGFGLGEKIWKFGLGGYSGTLWFGLSDNFHFGGVFLDSQIWTLTIFIGGGGGILYQGTTE